MTLRNTTLRWGAVSQSLHWVIVALIITQVILATVAEDTPLPRKIGILAWHKSVGITVLVLAIIRLLWRWANPTPLLPTTLKPYERVLAHVTHTALYVVLF